jgi:signal transduction histidine kinase
MLVDVDDHGGLPDESSQRLPQGSKPPCAQIRRTIYACSVSTREQDDPIVDPEAQRLHDLRQPLSAIFAAATAMRMRADLPEDDREKLVDIIIRNAERLSEMLEQASAR